MHSTVDNIIKAELMSLLSHADKTNLERNDLFKGAFNFPRADEMAFRYSMKYKFCF